MNIPSWLENPIALSMNAWFHAIVVCLLTAAWIYFRGHTRLRCFLAAAAVYFCMRVWWECEMMKEYAIEDVPIRIDLGVLAPIDLLFCSAFFINSVMIFARKK